MKFSIIDAAKQAREIIGHECTINCSMNDNAYLVQIKVVMPLVRGTIRNQIYGQQIAFTEREVLMDDGSMLNTKYLSALQSLKLQIEG